MNIRTLCLIAGCAAGGTAVAAPAPVIQGNFSPMIGEYRAPDMEWDVSYRMYKYINGEKVFGQWISANAVRDAVRAQNGTAASRGAPALEQAFDSLGQNILVSSDLFGLEVCGFGAGTDGARYTSAADIWSETWEGISIDPSQAGAMVDGIEFGWQPNAIPFPASGPHSPNVFESFAGQHAGCHQLLWNVEVWESFDAGTDTDMDGTVDTIGAFPILDTMGMQAVDGDGDALFTPANFSGVDTDMDGNVDQFDDFLGGYQLFIIGGFNPPDDDGNGTIDVDEFICPDVNLSGDPFDDWFNPIEGGGWTVLGNYAQIGGGNFDSDINTGFTSAIDAGLGTAFDVDGDGNADVPLMPADGEGAIRIQAFNVDDSDLDGTFDVIDGGALVGGIVFNGTDEAYVQPGFPGPTPGDSDGLTWFEGENRLGEPSLTVVTDTANGPVDKAAGDDAYTTFEVATFGDLDSAFDSDMDGNADACIEDADATAMAVYVAAGGATLFDCADANQDGSVTPTDFGAWLNNFNMGNGQADANGDNSITPTDFGAWLNAFNNAGSFQCDFDLGI